MKSIIQYIIVTVSLCLMSSCNGTSKAADAGEVDSVVVQRDLCLPESGLNADSIKTGSISIIIPYDCNYDTASDVFVYISLVGDEHLSTDSLRKKVICEAIHIYNSEGVGRNANHELQLNVSQIERFAALDTFGIPFAGLPEYLDMVADQRSLRVSGISSPDGQGCCQRGIPVSECDLEEGPLNDFQVWMKAICSVAFTERCIKVKASLCGNGSEEMLTDDDEREDRSENDSDLLPDSNMCMLYDNILTGYSLIIRAHRDTPYTAVNKVFKNLRSLGLNRFTMSTTLKQVN